MKHKHLTIKKRETIEDMLKEKSNLTDIAKVIGKHKTTISKEILNHRFKNQYKHFNSSFANCELTYSCDEVGSKQCRQSCINLKEKVCLLLQKAPYVCNGCKKENFVDYLNIIIEQKTLMHNIKNLELILELV